MLRVAALLLAAGAAAAPPDRTLSVPESQEAAVLQFYHQGGPYEADCARAIWYERGQFLCISAMQLERMEAQAERIDAPPERSTAERPKQTDVNKRARVLKETEPQQRAADTSKPESTAQ